jgi:hypothetical protein
LNSIDRTALPENLAEENPANPFSATAAQIDSGVTGIVPELFAIYFSRGARPGA